MRLIIRLIIRYLVNYDGTSKIRPLAVRIFRAVVVLFAIIGLSYFIYQSALLKDKAKFPFKYGLDISGGVQLVYTADTSQVDPSQIDNLMQVLRGVIEKRVNLFGVGEPQVYTDTSSAVSGETKHRLVVELPGLTDIDAAVAQIGQTPNLEFTLLGTEAANFIEKKQRGETLTEEEQIKALQAFVPTGLSGRYITHAELMLNSGRQGASTGPSVAVMFNEEGAKLFEDVTRAHVGEQMAILLDGSIISVARINEAIPGGTALISGSLKLDEARELVDNLNFGALPMPVSLESTQLVDASLGSGVLSSGVKAGAVGLILITAFMLLWYRAGGFVSVIGLAAYTAIMIALFMLIPVTLTAAGIAGFILSIGMAVDANVLIFERFKEEYRSGKSTHEAIQIGFARAWTAIRDGNITSLLAAVVLYWFGASFVQGFAFVLIIGILVSMFTAISVTRVFAYVLPDKKRSEGGVWSYLLSAGIKR